MFPKNSIVKTIFIAISFLTHIAWPLKKNYFHRMMPFDVSIAVQKKNFSIIKDYEEINH